MLTRSLKAASLLNYQAPRMMRGFATAKKDYYEILGLNNDASVDEIKTAYRNLAKRFHPDVNAGGEAYQGDAEKFRDVVEAYQVLSVQESRTAYDLKNQSAPDFIYRAQRMEAERKYNARGKDGNPIQEPYPSGSYAEQKRDFLANERKKFNVNEFGRYNGGVPRKDRGTTRGSAMGSPGAFHDPFLHNLKINPSPDSQFVTSADALAFKNYMMEDRYSLKRKGTWFQATVDFDYFKFNTYRYGWRWIRNVFLIVFGMTGAYDIINRTRNRQVLDQISTLGKEANLQAGVKLSDGRVVKQGSTGIVKIV